MEEEIEGTISEKNNMFIDNLAREKNTHAWISIQNATIVYIRMFCVYSAKSDTFN